MVGATWLLCRRLLEGPRFKTQLGHLATGKFCQPINKWVPVLNQGKIRQQKEKDGLCLVYAVRKIQWASNTHCPDGH